MEKQLVALQEMLSHQAADIASMSHEMYAQQREIAELKRQVKRLSEQLQQSQPEAHEGGYEPPPPHY